MRVRQHGRDQVARRERREEERPRRDERLGGGRLDDLVPAGGEESAVGRGEGRVLDDDAVDREVGPQKLGPALESDELREGHARVAVGAADGGVGREAAEAEADAAVDAEVGGGAREEVLLDVGADLLARGGRFPLARELGVLGFDLRGVEHRRGDLAQADAGGPRPLDDVRPAVRILDLAGLREGLPSLLVLAVGGHFFCSSRVSIQEELIMVGSLRISTFETEVGNLGRRWDR